MVDIQTPSNSDPHTSHSQSDNTILPNQVAPVPQQPVPTRRFPKRIVIISTLLLFGVISIISLQHYLNKQQSLQGQSSPVPTVIDPISTPDTTVDWEIYSNQKYNFSFSYPQEWQRFDEIFPPLAYIKSDIPLVKIESNIISDYYESSVIGLGEPIRYILFVGIEDQDTYNNWRKETVSKSNILDLQIGSHPAHQTKDFPGGSRGSLNTFIEIENDKHLRVTIWPYFKNSLTDDQYIIRSQYDQILSTFKFFEVRDDSKIEVRYKQKLHILQLEGPVTDGCFSQIQSEVKILQYYAPLRYLVYGSEQAVSGIECVISSDIYQVKISEELYKQSDPIKYVSVTVYDDFQVNGTVDNYIQFINELGGEDITRSKGRADDPFTTIRFVLSVSKLESVVNNDYVVWVNYLDPVIKLE